MSSPAASGASTRPELPSVIGVVGAGTMGAGIAQLACRTGARTLLHDPDSAALERGARRIRAQLERGAERGRWSTEEAARASEALQTVASLEELAPCGLIIEAVPERLELKRELFAALARVVSENCVLATNTSSLLVTALAEAGGDGSRVVGMHFFNPPPVMRLLEVVAGVQSAPWAVAVARAVGEAMGKHVIIAADGPGFIVNRCNRPFGLEALKLLQEQIADVPEIDRALRQGGGFRMGPFEVMDLVGVDVGFDVARSFYEQSFGEPRWRPSPITVRTIAAGRLGRKSGRGYYEYPEHGEHRSPDPPPPAPGGGDGLVVIAGDTVLAEELRAAAGAAGWAVADPLEAQRLASPELILDLTGGEESGAPLQGAPQALCVAAGSLTALDPAGSAVGFHALPPLASSHLVELSRGPDSAQSAIAAADHFFTTLGKHTLWVGDAPGLILGRIVAQVINEAAFASGEGLGSAEDIDAGMVHGLNYPRGILAWADMIGIDHVLSILDALYLERGEERYRVAPALRALGWSGRLGVHTGAGFFSYEEAR